MTEKSEEELVQETLALLSKIRSFEELDEDLNEFLDIHTQGNVKFSKLGKIVQDSIKVIDKAFDDYG